MHDRLAAKSLRVAGKQADAICRADGHLFRGNQTAQVPATVGKTVFEVDEGFNVLLRYESRDFLILAADLVLGGKMRCHKKGDQFMKHKARRFTSMRSLPRVKNLPGGLAIRRKTLRIHI